MIAVFDMLWLIVYDVHLVRTYSLVAFSTAESLLDSGNIGPRIKVSASSSSATGLG